MSAIEQAEQLLRSLLDRRELGVAVELDRHAGRLDGLPHGVLDGDHLIAILLSMISVNCASA